MPSLFSMPLQQATWADVVAFVSAWGEGTRVEYKKDLVDGSKRAKILSSFANSQGGVWVAGVSEEKTEGRHCVLGIERTPDMELQVEQAGQDGCYPPLLPEVVAIQKCDDPTKVVIVARVEPSPNAPHFVQNRTECYVREGRSSKPVRADSVALEQLFQRRRDGEEGRNRVIVRMRDQLGPWASGGSWRWKSEGGTSSWGPTPSTEVLVAPLWIRSEIVSRGDLQKVMTVDVWEDRTRLVGRSVFRGWVIDHPGKRGMVAAQEGAFLQVKAAPIGEPEWTPVGGTSDGDRTRGILVEGIDSDVDEMLRRAARVVNGFRYQGLLRVRIGMQGLDDQMLISRHGAHGDYRPEEQCTRDDTFAIEETLPAAVLAESAERIRKEFLRVVLWTFNLDPYR